jgi:phage-related protein
MEADKPILKPVRWIGTSREDPRDFPAEVRRNVGLALHIAQAGDNDRHATPEANQERS